MSECEKYLESISCLVDGELSQSESHALAAHLAACPECRMVLEAFTELGHGLADNMVRAPEGLADGIMYKIEMQENPGRSPRRRSYFGKFTAIAACLVLVIVASSRFLPSLKNAEPAEKSLSVPEAYSGENETTLTDNDLSGQDGESPRDAADDAELARGSDPDAAQEEDMEPGDGSAVSFGSVGDTELQYTLVDPSEAKRASDALSSLTSAQIIDLGAPEDPGITLDSAGDLSRLAEILRWDGEASAGIPNGAPGYSLILTGTDGASSSIELWLTHDGIICGTGDDSGSVYRTFGTVQELLEFISG